MRTIYKYQIPDNGKFTLELPERAKILCVQIQNEYPHVWVELETQDEKIKRQFTVYGTGFSMPQCEIESYISTWQDGKLVWHLYETL